MRTPTSDTAEIIALVRCARPRMAITERYDGSDDLAACARDIVEGALSASDVEPDADMDQVDWHAVAFVLCRRGGAA